MKRIVFERDGYDCKILIDEMPYRKKPCLCVEEGNCETKFASFNDEEAAKKFIKIFAEFVGAEEVEE